MRNVLKKTAQFLPENIRRPFTGFYHRLFDRFPKITQLGPLNANLTHCYEWFQHAAHYLRVNRLQGVYAEFGCHEANTFRIALNTLGNYRRFGGNPPVSRFYAFDSFEGMPEPKGIDRQKIWRGGMNATPEAAFRRLCRRDLHRMKTVKGFYDEVLPRYSWDPAQKIVLAYIDCDYYESTVPALTFLKDKLAHGAILAFDDWNCYYGDPERGEKKAFAQFQEEMKKIFHFEPFLPISFGGMSFFCLQKNLIGQEVM